MNGCSSHALSPSNDEGERYRVKFHFETDQGVENLTEEAKTIQVRQVVHLYEADPELGRALVAGPELAVEAIDVDDPLAVEDEIADVVAHLVE